MTMLTVATLPTVFDDIKPLAQDDGPHPVCVIDYKPDFEIAHDYLRAVLKKNEKSERALALTGMCLAFNPANYTVWHYRREILKELGFEVQAELEWSAGLGGSNPKNYQLWHHRRALLEHVGSFDVAKELEYVAVVLKDDGKKLSCLVASAMDPTEWQLGLLGERVDIFGDFNYGRWSQQ